MRDIFADDYIRTNFITKEIEQKLIANFKVSKAALSKGKPRPDHKPVVKFICIGCNEFWLVSELDPDNYQQAFGLNYCSYAIVLDDIPFSSLYSHSSARFFDGMQGHDRSVENLQGVVDRDLHWEATKTLSEYLKEGQNNKELVMDWHNRAVMAAREILIDKGFVIDMEIIREALNAATVAQDFNPQSIKKDKELAYEYGYRDALSEITQSLVDLKKKSNKRLQENPKDPNKNKDNIMTL